MDQMVASTSSRPSAQGSRPRPDCGPGRSRCVDRPLSGAGMGAISPYRTGKITGFEERDAADVGESLGECELPTRVQDQPKGGIA